MSPTRENGQVGVHVITVPRRGSVVPVFPSRDSRLVSLARVQNRPLGTSIACLLLAVNRWPQMMCLVHEPKHCGMFGPLVQVDLICLTVVLVMAMVRLLRLENSRLWVCACLWLSLLVSRKAKLGALALLTSVSAMCDDNLDSLGLVMWLTIRTVRRVPEIDVRALLVVSWRNLLM